MLYNFVQFTSFGSKYTPIISLGETGGFGFSSGFYHRYNLKNNVALELYYDEDSMAVGFRFMDTATENSLKLRPRATGGYIGARSFLGKYGIDPKKYSGRYEPKEIQDEKLGRIFVIELKETGEVVHS